MSQESLKATILPEIIEFRHQFHQHPELSNQEFVTTKRITEILTKWGIPIVPTDLNTGLLAEIKGEKPGITIALRADIDALPIQEETDLVYKSQNNGVMHACGHDLHFSSLLGAAYILNQNKKILRGNVRLLFQPAEEQGHGGDQVLEKHVLDGVKTIVGFHNDPTLPVGQIALASGPLMAGCYHIKITLHGQGSHAAKPENSQDVITAQAAIITQLQTIVSRNLDPFHAVVLSITKVEAGTTWNVLPDVAVLTGTVRTFNDADTALVKKRFYQIVENTAAAYDQTVDIEWIVGAYPINNDKKITEIVKESLNNKVIKPTLTMTGEDFATFEQQIPGTFAFIGSNGADNAVDVHDDHFVGLDETISSGIDYFVQSTYGLLNHLSKEG